MESGRFEPETLTKIERELGREQLRDIVELFLDLSPARIEQVREGGRTGDLQAAADALHSIKSSAAMLGAREFLGVAERMERLARENDHGGFSALQDDLVRSFQRARRFLLEQTGGADR